MACLIHLRTATLLYLSSLAPIQLSLSGIYVSLVQNWDELCNKAYINKLKILTEMKQPSPTFAEFKSGILDELPLQAGIVPFGMVYGILGVESGMSALETFMLSSILFGGASQIVFTQLLAVATLRLFWSRQLRRLMRAICSIQHRCCLI